MLKAIYISYLFMNTTNYIKVDELSSTNDYLKKLSADDELPEGSVVVAKYQNNGRGQGENRWESEYGKNLIFSLLLRPKFLHAEHMFMISKVISLGIIDYLNKFDNNFTIKWPNDIYHGNKKLGGILIENNLLGNSLSYSFVGIGININQEVFISNAPNPISLINIFNEKFDLGECLNGLTKQIDIWYERLKKSQFDKIDEAYFSHLFRNTNYHNYKSDNELFSAQIVNVERDGKLILKTSNNEVKSFYFKEVEFVL